MTWTAQQPQVREAALSSAVGDGDDVIDFPARFCITPLAERAAGTGGGPRPAPLAVGPHEVEEAPLTDTAIALPDEIARVAHVAADAPLVHAAVAAERPAGWPDQRSTTPAHCAPGGIAIWLAPRFTADASLPEIAHAFGVTRSRNGKIA